MENPSGLVPRPALPSSLVARETTTLRGIALARTIVRLFRATLHGAHHLPRSGPALLVGNHSLMGIDALPLAALLVVHTGRAPRFLGERTLWKFPGLGALLGAAGAIPGEPHAAVELLRAGELVGVYPGGVDDSFKLASERYQLKWGSRAGFARVAMRAGAAIVPVAAEGIDELFTVRRRERWLGRRLFGSARYDLPLPTRPYPRRVPLAFHVLPRIDTAGDPDDPAAVERVRLATWTALESVLAPLRG